MENKKIQLKKLKKFWKGKRVFVTGHTGFKGSWMCILLNLLETQIIGYSLKPEKKSLFLLANIKDILKKNIYADILNIKKLNKEIKLSKPDIIIHLAAQSLVGYSYVNPFDTFNTNVMGTLNILDCIKKFRSIKSSVIVTTDKVYKIKGQKSYIEEDELGGYDPYSSSKVCSEIVANSYIKSFCNKNTNLKYVSTARSGNVIGGGDYAKNRLIPDIFRAIENKKKLIIRNPNSIRPWQHVIEPSVGYLLLAQKNYQKKINALSSSWNFGPNFKNFKSVMYIVNKIEKYYKFKFSIIKKKAFHETQTLKLNSEKSHKYLNWKPIWNLNDVLNKTIEWDMLNTHGINAKEICENQILSYFNA